MERGEMRFYRVLTTGLFLIAAFVAQACGDFATVDEQMVDRCPDDPQKVHPGVCGCGKEDVIDAVKGGYSCINQGFDLCPNDPQKVSPGYCGCGIVDVLDKDGAPLCLGGGIDLCPDDEDKQTPGVCGCGVQDTLDPKTGVPQCLSSTIDLCPQSAKTHPGICGCDVEDIIDPETGIPQCLSDVIDFCPQNEHKKKPGVCGCDAQDIDSDSDTVADCMDSCPDNPELIQEGVCGCDVVEQGATADDDADTIPNCLDACPKHSGKHVKDSCECTESEVQLSEKVLCATRIETAEDFITLRDKWNTEATHKDLPKNYVLSNDINLATVLSAQDLEAWVGVGSSALPFDGIFVGNEHTISISLDNELVELKSPNDYLALFGVAREAKFDALRVEAKFSGQAYVGILVAYAEKSVFSNIVLRGSLKGKQSVGCLAGAMRDSSVLEAKSEASVEVSVQDGALLVGSIYNSKLDKVAAYGSITAPEAKQIGGVTGFAGEASQIYNALFEGRIHAQSAMGGLVGSLENKANIVNAYALGEITSTQGNAGGLVGQVNDFCRINNAYALCTLKSTKPESSALGSAIGAILSKDNINNLLYFWSQSGAVSAVANYEEGVSLPQSAFVIDSGKLVLQKDQKSLTDELNHNLSCIDDGCSFEGISSTKWTSKTLQLHDTKIELPTLEFGPELKP